MKGLHDLLECIDYYVFDGETERIIVKDGPGNEVATIKYKSALKIVDEKYYSEEELRFTSYHRWVLDIAIDVVRRMSEEEREYMSVHLASDLYHFGCGLTIRNQYIYKAKRKRTYNADLTSGEVIERMFSIVSPHYDYTDPRCTEYHESPRYFGLVDDYGEKYPDVFRKVDEALMSDGSQMSAGEAADMLALLLSEINAE